MSYFLDLDKIFSYHAPLTPEARGWHARVRHGARILAKDWELFIPNCPEKTLAIRKLQEAMMYANSAIAQNHDSLPPLTAVDDLLGRD